MGIWGKGSPLRRENGDLFGIRLGRAFGITEMLNTDTIINLLYCTLQTIHRSTQSTSPELHQGAFEETTSLPTLLSGSTFSFTSKPLTSSPSGSWGWKDDPLDQIGLDHVVYV